MWRRMPPTRASALTLAALAVAVSCVHAARAAAAENGIDGEHVHIAYITASGCPSEAEFLDAIARDGGRLVRARDDEPARSFVVTVEASTPLAGRLVVHDIDGSQAARPIEGDHCDDVVRSLAVLVALSLKPIAFAALGPTPPAILAKPAPGTVERPSRRIDTRPSRWRASVSAEGTFGGGATPTLAPGLAAYVEVGREVSGIIVPSVRLGGEIIANFTINEIGAEPSPLFNSRDGAATFKKVVARLDGCPFEWLASQPWDTDTLTAQACARVDTGPLDVRSTDTYSQSRDVRRLWAAAGAILRVRWNSPVVFVEANGGVIFPITRARFFADIGGTSFDVFDVPVAAPTMGFGMGVSL